MHLRQILLLLLFFLSGFTGLIYQVIWSQQFSLVFGSTEVAVAAVLAAYMGGLASGAYIMGRCIYHVKKPVIWYALFELLLAIIALNMFGLIDTIGHFYSWAFGTDELVSINKLYTPIYVLGAFMVLVVPTALMGATLPLLSKFVITSDQKIGSGIGALYATNTFGACFGALMAAFLLIPYLGLEKSIHFAVGINALIFILGILFFKTQSISSSTHSKTTDVTDTTMRHPWLLLVMFFSGLVAFSHEVMWTRLLSHLLGGSIYAFGVMLFMFLLGIGLGAILGYKLSQLRNKMLCFAFLQVGIGALFLISFVFADQLTNLPISNDFGGLKFLFSAIYLGLITLLPGAVLIGATFPLAIEICTTNYKHAPSTSSRIYAWNTTGAICGALLCGFILLSHFGFADTTRILTLLSFALACLVALKSQQSKIIQSVLCLIFVVVAMIPIHEPFRILSFSPLGNKQQTGDIDFLAVGQSSTVILLDNKIEKRLLTNGLPESSIQRPGDRISKYHLAWWLSKLPVISRPEANTALIIGLGAGLTLKAVPDSIKQIDVIELEQEVIHANQSAAKWRVSDPLADKRLRLHHNDARNALRNSQQKFDIVISQPSHPWTAGASNLYTQEFFTSVNSRLNQSGVFVQWIGMRFIDKELLKSLLATLNAEFKYVELFQPLSQGGLIFMASNEKLDINQNKFSISQDLEQWRLLGVNSWLELMLSRRLNASQSKEFSAGGYLSTDQHNIMKIRSPKVLKNSISKTEFDRMLAPFDWHLDSLTYHQAIAATQRMIKEGQVIRLSAMIKATQHSELNKLISAMSQYAFFNKKIAKTQLLELLNSEKHSHSVLHYLISEEPALTWHNPHLHALIKKDELAMQVLDSWRLLKLKKWSSVQQFDESLGNISADHMLYDMSKLLRIEWRQQSSQTHYLLQALVLTDELLSAKKSIELLSTRADLALKLQNSDVLLTVMHEIKRMAVQNTNSNNSAKVTFQSLLEQLKTMQKSNSSFADAVLSKFNA